MATNAPTLAPAVSAEIERCVGHLQAMASGEHMDIWYDIMIVAMRTCSAATVEAARAKCAELVAAQIFGDDGPDAPLRGVLAAIQGGDPVE